MRRDTLTLIQEADDFPTLSTVSMKVMQMALDPEVSLKEFAEVMMLDVTLSTRILKVVNSAYYGLSR
ncbi:MAG: HDOD domain-containing protein, partial [Candidatus Latescibacteria bacterium]|nr:HDOD domain-containing protein [Candidatus Latescibacterota bacterium]